MAKSVNSPSSKSNTWAIICQELGSPLTQRRPRLLQKGRLQTPQTSEIFPWSRKLLHEIYNCIFPAVSRTASISFEEQAFSLGTGAGKVISRLKVCFGYSPNFTVSGLKSRILYQDRRQHKWSVLCAWTERPSRTPICHQLWWQGPTPM